MNNYLKKKDYLAILQYYDIDPVKMTSRQIKKRAEDILAQKLCSCIEKVNN